MKNQENNKLLVAQLGARRHYAIPRILYQGGVLENFYTDICAVKGLPKYLRLIPNRLQTKSIARLTGRIPEGVPSDVITAFSSFGFEYAQRIRKAHSSSELTQTILWAGKTFGKLILNQGRRGTGVYTFNNAGLEILQAAKKQGLITVMDQTIAPKQLQHHLMLEEQELHPDWEEPIPYDKYRSEHIEREKQEWEQANLILCGSEFVRDGIKKCGGPVERCAIVPYGVDTRFQPSLKKPHQEPLRILTVGSVELRKGTPYVLEAAKRLKGKATFRLVGPIHVSASAISALREHLELVGQVPRSQIKAHYDWADVFLLPSICEGSAAATYEALASGLPVITTPNSGSIVRDGIEGYIVPIRDVDKIVEAIELLISQPEILHSTIKSAQKRTTYGSFNSYSERLLNVLNN